MKRLLELTGCLLIALSCIVFYSCSSSDDADAGTGGRDLALVGDWHCVIPEGGVYFTIGWKFDANGNCYFDEWSYTQNHEWGYFGKWSTSDNILTLVWSDEEDEKTGVEEYFYSITDEGKTLTLTTLNGKNTEIFTKQ